MVTARVTLSTPHGQIDANTGLPDADGLVWWVNVLDGWYVADETHAATERPEDDGSWVDEGRTPARVVTVKGFLGRGSDIKARRVLSAVAKTKRVRGLIRVEEADGQVLEAEYVRTGAPLVRDGNGDEVDFALVLLCPAGLLRSPTVNELSVLASVSTADTEGTIMPDTMPAYFFWAGQVADRPVTAFNAGDEPVRPVVVFRGPVTNPALVLTTTGDRIAADIALGPGDYLEVDMRARTAMLNGSSPRQGAITTDSVWWALQPGPNPLRFEAAVYSVDVPSLIRWSDTYA